VRLVRLAVKIVAQNDGDFVKVILLHLPKTVAHKPNRMQSTLTQAHSRSWAN